MFSYLDGAGFITAKSSIGADLSLLISIAAFVMLAASTDQANPLIREAVAAFPTSPWRGAILPLLLLGFTLKMGLFPLHIWMPLAHSVAPAPVVGDVTLSI